MDRPRLPVSTQIDPELVDFDKVPNVVETPPGPVWGVVQHQEWSQEPVQYLVAPEYSSVSRPPHRPSQTSP